MYQNHILTEKNIVICFDDKTVSYPRSHPEFETIKARLERMEFDDLDISEDFEKNMKKSHLPEGVVIRKGRVFVDGKSLPVELDAKVMEFYKQGLPLYPLINFHRNLLKNPSAESKKDLFLFLMKNQIPITEKGMFRAYKYVREDFKDCHSGKYDNSPGKTPEMRREDVNANRNETCSHGLHVAAWGYVSGHEMVVEVQVNPKDVVSVPTDYNAQKMRVCRYKVVRVVRGENPNLLEKDSSEEEEEIEMTL